MKNPILPYNSILGTGVLLFSLLFMLGSCEKVINVDLDSAEKKYVIEAVVTDSPGTSFVKISRTKNFGDNNYSDIVSGAIVTIQENGTTSYTFTKDPNSDNYKNSTIIGKSGSRYNLSVKINGQVFTAESTMPAKVNLDTIFVTDELIFTSNRKVVNAVFNDPPGLGNSYRFVQFVNGYQETQTMIRNDDYSDGRKIVNKLFYLSNDDEEKRNIKSGDQVMIDMLCIEPAVYKYWFSLDRSAIGNGQQATPSNPVTNISGGALGYFSAHTIQTKSIVVP